MALQSLALYAYNLITGARQDYSSQVEELRFTTTAPGGYGDLMCKLKVPNARLLAQRSELALFANVAVMDGPFPAYLGRWSEPAIVLDRSEGDLVELTAQGAAMNCKDDPQDSSYTNQTANFITNDQMTSAALKRNQTLALDPDQSQVFPTNPSPTSTSAYNGKTLEDVMNDLVSNLGDFTWEVWGHLNYQLGSALHADAAGFPTWQMYAHVRNTTTQNYTGYLVDENSYDIRPSIDYAYNVATILYRDNGTLLPAVVTVTDSRLNANGSQGTAPFPWRRIRKDLTGLRLTATQAQGIANALLSDYMNGGAKVQVDLSAVRDANGRLIPLWQVRADSNIFLPELAPLASQLPTTQTQYAWYGGGTLFYVTETEYSEASGQTPTLTLTCNSFKDTATFQIAALESIAQKQAHEKKLHSPIQAVGEPLQGYFSYQVNPTTNNAVFIEGINFHPTLSQAATSVTLSVTASSNASSIVSQNPTALGFQIQWTAPSSASASSLTGTWVTVGN